MANQVMNFTRGQAGYYADPANGLSGANSRIVIVILSLAEADDTLNNYDELNALLIAAGNAEADATGYARIEIAAANVTRTVDDTGNDAQFILDADQTFSSISNDDTNGDWNKLLVCYDADNGTGTDANILVLSHHDFVVTPNGGDITANFDQVAGVIGWT